MVTERLAFGAELRRARERRGLTLDAIAEQTKVGAAHYAGLEKGDVSRWPSGIFRRAFVRSYAVAVGLDPEETLARFLRSFPDPGDEVAGGTEARPANRSHTSTPSPAVPDAVVEATAQAEEDQPRRAALPLAAGRLLSGVLDIGLATAPATVVALLTDGRWFWPAAAAVAVAGHLASAATLGSTPGAWFVAWLTAHRTAASADRAERRRGDPGTPPARRRTPRQARARSTPHVHRLRH